MKPELQRLLYGLFGKTISIETASGKGISAQGVEEGGQFSDEKDDNDIFRLHRVERGVFKFQSVASGLYLGISPNGCDCPCGQVLWSALVSEDDATPLSVIDAKNDDDDYMSFEPSTNPGFILTCAGGKIFFYGEKLADGEDFASHSSWKFVPAYQPEDQIMEALSGDVPVVIKSETDGTSFAAAAPEVGCAVTCDGSDIFKIRNVQPFVYKLESNMAPGTFLGVGGEIDEGVFSCILVDSEDAYVQVTSSRSGTEDVLSITSVSQPGCYLCIKDGLVCFAKDAEDDASWTIAEYLKDDRAHLDNLQDEEILFRAENDYGISTQDKDGKKIFKLWDDGDADMGEQLFNTPDEDRWRITKIADCQYKFESVTTPGAFIGVGERDEVGNSNNFGYQAILVPGDHDRGVMRVIPPNSGSEGFVSFECMRKPGYMLCHCCGKIWWLKEGPNEKWPVDSSWQLSA